MRPVALITGASAGIGREFAIQLAKRGYDLVLVARDEGRLRALADELAAYGVSAEVLGADLARDDDVSRVVARIDQSPIDLLVNNAGFGTRRSFARESREQQDAMIRVHVLAANRLAQAAVQSMVPRRTGAIINVSSVASWLTTTGNVNYSATKAWQRIFIESLSLELEGTGVYAQALCPGYTRTEFHARGEMDMSHTPAWMWTRADQVVTASLTALERRTTVVVIPRLAYKLIVLGLRFLPHWLQRLVLGTFRGRRMVRRMDDVATRGREQP